MDQQCDCWALVKELQRKLDAEGERADNLAIELEDARAEYDRLKADRDRLADLYGRIASLLADAQGKISAALSYTED
jgi:chromosome segregation ATPase